MSDTVQTVQSSPPPTNTTLAVELAHVTQEMYKKNFELVERNKTLSILRKIHEIILSAVTDTSQIAEQVANTVVTEAEFKAVVILTLDKEKNALVRLAISQTEPIAKAEMETERPFFPDRVSLSDEENFVVQAVKAKKTYIAHNLLDILQPYAFQNQVEKLQTILNIKASLVYPFIVRDQVIGAMIICIGESETLLFQYQQDLIERLSGVVGIAIDNALLYKELQLANETLEQLDKLKDEFVSLASHELRTPMTAIKSYLWMALMGKGDTPEKQKLFLDRAYKSTDRLIKLVNDMLNVSRIESGRVILALKPVKLNNVIAETIAEILPRAQELGVNLVFTPDATMPDVSADTDKIKEVLINLVGNSLKFTPKDGSITISFTKLNGMAYVKITDTGKGISNEDMPKLFQKFSKLNENYLVKQNAQGTGLGLYISKSLVELHGGRIWVDSEGEGKGTTFSFTLTFADSKQGLQQVQQTVAS